MRIIKEEFKVYKFNELDESTKQKALEKLWDINIHEDWFDSVYEDAKNIGVQINEFNIDRGSFCRIKIEDIGETLKLIKKNHGKLSETYELMEKTNEVITQLTIQAFENNELDEGGFSDDIEETMAYFEQQLSEEYFSILRKEYEYLTSEEAIIETIEANEYEFKENGEIY